MIGNNYWNVRCWEQKKWKYGKLLLIWQKTAADCGLWRLFLSGCEPGWKLPAERLLEFRRCSPNLQQKMVAVHDFLDQKTSREISRSDKDLLCTRQRFTLFETAVFNHLAQIPAGKVVSYGALASRAGYPRAARAVGRVMANNPFPLFYPCHRVIKADGGLGKFGGGANLKRQLLTDEGVVFRSPRHVAPAHCLNTGLNSSSP